MLTFLPDTPSINGTFTCPPHRECRADGNRVTKLFTPHVARGDVNRVRAIVYVAPHTQTVKNRVRVNTSAPDMMEAASQTSPYPNWISASQKYSSPTKVFLA